MRTEGVKNGWKNEADMPLKHFAAQAAINTHLSQPAGDGAFDGQHGISCDMSAADVSTLASATDEVDA